MWPNLLFILGLVTFMKEILDGRFHYLCSGMIRSLVLNELSFGKIQYRKCIEYTWIWSKFCVNQAVGIKLI